jgi:tripartite-type tricarboxylate transporter receptor subunit TctC
MEEKTMQLARLALSAATLFVLSHVAQAQEKWPDRPIRLIVTSAAGGGIDLMARILADGLSRQLPKAVIVENNGGAGGLVATRLVAKADPDGYTFLFQGPGYADLPFIRSAPGFDVYKDFASVSLVAKYPLVLITNPSLDVKTLPEFIALAKKSPGKYTYGSSGIGGASNIAMEALDRRAGIELVHVPFSGSGQTSAAVLAGQIDITIDGLAPQLGNIESHRLVPLAVTTLERSPRLPELPTVVETLPGYQYPMWVGVFAPGKTPKEIVEKMSLAINRALNDTAAKKRFEELIVDPIGSTPSEFQQFVDEQLVFHKNIIEQANIKIGDQ